MSGVESPRTGGRSTPSRIRPRPSPAVVVAVLAFFVVTLDAVVVNVALPSIRESLGGGIQGLQWVVDGYALMFAATLLTAGSLSDRFGAKRAMGYGITLFVLTSAACGLAPTLGLLVLSRLLQGAAAAIMMPSSMALIGQAHDDPVRRARAVAAWATGGAVASSSGPLIGGLLTLVDWRLVFLVNLPVGIAGLLLLRRTTPSPHSRVPLDVAGQVTAVIAMGGLTYAVIDAGEEGIGAPRVVVPFVVAVVAAAGFVVSQARGSHPMVPLSLVRSPTMPTAMVIGFSFMVGFYGVPFLFSLYFQQVRTLTPLATGLAFMPMMVVGLVLSPFAAVIVERLGSRIPIVGGLGLMALGLVCLAILAPTAPLWVVSALMVLIGLGGPLTMPPTVAVLLNSVPSRLAGTASGVFNTSRQVGGALAIALFGALLADSSSFVGGLRSSLLIGAAVLLAAAVAAVRLPRVRPRSRAAEGSTPT
ncbi:MFS transporter [Pedococcus sp. 5OH_020]|uniref:MFS transporter n=1 Tax=Pedococcus sp. 5OH_020 TaxID=2989814 RepID=UPI0022E9FD5D|nr:MFS transporter [Pedococcus sp. 5OH_020]